MSKENKYKTYFAIASTLTDYFPCTGAKMLNKSIPVLLSNWFVIHKNLQKNIKILRKIQKFENILVISDLNIGDAVNLQASITALRLYFPESTIDYLVNPIAKNIIEGNKEISQVLSFFSGNAKPTEEDNRKLAHLIQTRDYDLILNFCPLFENKIFSTKADRTIHYQLLAANLIKNEQRNETINHITYQAFSFVNLLFSHFFTSVNHHKFTGIQIVLPSFAINQAQAFLKANDLFQKPIQLFFNPDTSSQFTRLPLPLQIKIMNALLGLEEVQSVLLGAGHKAHEIEVQIIRSLPTWKRKKITIIPNTMPIETYAALIDFSDIFISGDTGPLHIASARKLAKSGNYKFRNQTSVLSIFGATPSKIYGYDSNKKGYLPANQNARSCTFVAESICRNITCINKIAKNCKRIRCFDNLNIHEIVQEVQNLLKKTQTQQEPAGTPQLCYGNLIGKIE